MAIRGIFTAHSGIQGDRVGDFASNVLMHMPQGTAPFLGLTSGMQVAPVADTSFSWLEDEHINGVGAASAQTLAAATTIPVAGTSLWVPNTILLNADTGERILISAISGNNLTVIRGIAGTTAATIETTHKLHNIGTAFGEGSGKPVAISQRGESRTNNVQIFKNGWAVTGTANAIGYQTGSQLASNKRQCAAYHAEDIEKSFLWGKKGHMTLNQQAVFLSDGVIEQIESYGGLIEDSSYGGNAGEQSMQGVFSFMRRIFDTNVKGAMNERVAMTSSLTLERINSMARMDSTYSLKEVDEKDSWGLSICKIEGLNGSLKIMTHPLFSSIGYHKLLVTHPQFIRKRELRKTVNQEFNAAGNTNNGVDAVEGFLLSHMGIEVGAARTMGILGEINTAVKSFA